MNNDEYIIEMLSWNNDETVQQQGIEQALTMDNIELLIQPDGNKSVWENCAKVLCEKSDDVLTPYLGPLLAWVQDITWPGAMRILDRLSIFNAELLLPPFSDAINQAIVTNDEEWINHLSKLLENKELMRRYKSIDLNNFGRLKKYYYDFWINNFE